MVRGIGYASLSMNVKGGNLWLETQCISHRFKASELIP